MVPKRGLAHCCWYQGCGSIWSVINLLGCNCHFSCFWVGMSCSWHFGTVALCKWILNLSSRGSLNPFYIDFCLVLFCVSESIINSWKCGEQNQTVWSYWKGITGLELYGVCKVFAELLYASFIDLFSSLCFADSIILLNRWALSIYISTIKNKGLDVLNRIIKVGIWSKYYEIPAPLKTGCTHL